MTRKLDPERTKFLNIDIYKTNTLKRLADKKNVARTYPIKNSDLMFIKKCPVCRSGPLSLISQVYLRSKLVFLETSSCPDCLFTFRTISPKLAWFKKCWKIIYNGKMEVFNPDVEELRKRRYQEYLEILPKYTRGNKVLDIGAAYGTGANLFKIHGWDVETVEPEISKVNYVRNFFGIPVVSDSIENFVLKKIKYDLVIFSQTLEHIDRPVFVIENIKNLLTPGSGILYIEIPVLENYVNWNDSLYLPHKCNFTEQNIVALLKHNGFEILDKFFVRQHSKETPWDVGMILKYSGNKKAFSIKPGLTLNDVKKIYRKDWPLKKVPPLEWTLKYNVPHIEQFFQILNLKNKVMIGPNLEKDFVSFKDSKNK